MSIDVRRVRHLKQKDYQNGPVVYWMNRDGRIRDNWALLYAQSLATQFKVPLFIAYNLEPNFLGGTLRQFDFKVGGLQEVAIEAQEKNMHFSLFVGEDAHKQMIEWITQEKIGYIVTDFSPLRISKQWQQEILKKTDIPMDEVDTHNIVPCWIASQKQEYGAYTIRPKINRLLPEFLTDFPALKKHPYESRVRMKVINWHDVHKHIKNGLNVKPIDWAIPGYKQGMKAMNDFIRHRLNGYAEKRNDPTLNHQSNLSPWFHYGHISPQRVAWEVRHAQAPLQDREAFLEELIVRRELSDNFCEYNPHYDQVAGFPNWAQQSLQKHESDKRAYRYSLKEFEGGHTHDALWNAAEHEMEHTGKMYGYMRMYWAKKILEWTSSPAEALKIAIYLNDTYELDGRDPNGYVGIAWSIGGLHDRAWVDRPIFGQIRYMNEKGCRRKFDVDAYIQRWNQKTLL